MYIIEIVIDFYLQIQHFCYIQEGSVKLFSFFKKLNLLFSIFYIVSIMDFRALNTTFVLLLAEPGRTIAYFKTDCM